MWAKQPALSCAPLAPHPLVFSGERVADKLARVGAQARPPRRPPVPASAPLRPPSPPPTRLQPASNHLQPASTRLHAAAGMVGLALACTEGDGVGQQISDVFLGGSEAGELLRAEPEP